MYFAKMAFNQNQVSPISKSCVPLNFSSILATLLWKPSGAGDHLPFCFRDAEIKVLMLRVIAGVYI